MVLFYCILRFLQAIVASDGYFEGGARYIEATKRHHYFFKDAELL
jgi:hypothetical protein